MSVRSHACETARSLASRSLDEALDDVPRDVLALHLEGCADCARFAREAEASTCLLRAAPLEAFRLELRRPLRRPAVGTRLPAVAAVAAAALAVGLASIAGGSTGPAGRTAAPGVAVVTPLKLPIGQRQAGADFAVTIEPSASET